MKNKILVICLILGCIGPVVVFPVNLLIGHAYSLEIQSILALIMLCTFPLSLTFVLGEFLPAYANVLLYVIMSILHIGMFFIFGILLCAFKKRDLWVKQNKELTSLAIQYALLFLNFFLFLGLGFGFSFIVQEIFIKSNFGVFAVICIAITLPLFIGVVFLVRYVFKIFGEVMKRSG